MKKRDKKKQAKFESIALKRALYEKARKRAYNARKAKQISDK
ncbi:MAG TPA: hypothetical protein VLH38_04940 [Patescibacteria group bacterium]|nr:hypothetical protein [Patescibacteria group bacterium]